MEVRFVFVWIVLLLGLIFAVGNADPVEDKRALLDFVSNFRMLHTLNWNENFTVCNNWTGVNCSVDGSRIVGLRLPGVGLHGPIPPNTLSRLSALQILSLRSNRINGPFPIDFVKLENLSNLYLQFNEFSGPLPSNFSVWKNLNSVDLSYNSFNGSIPYSLSNLSQLTFLNLANNSFSGEIPDIHGPSLQQLNLSNNHLTGVVPKSLQSFPNSSFFGNNVSFPLSPIVSPVPPPVAKRRNVVGKLRESVFWGITIAGFVAILIASTLLWVIYCLKRQGKSELSGKLPKGERSDEKAIPGSRDATIRLVFFEGCNYTFDLEDLLRASAEVLGKGTFGTAYKAVLEDATSVVVKRLKDVAAGKREFEQQMNMVGSIRHANVVELRAYYYSKDEKLVVYDSYSQGNVSARLHANNTKGDYLCIKAIIDDAKLGNLEVTPESTNIWAQPCVSSFACLTSKLLTGQQGEDRIPLDWDTRLRIAIGTARGVAYIHTQNSGKFVHGNIKSSNIFLNSENYGCVSDLGLNLLMSPVAPPVSHATGYRAPEVLDTRKAAQPSDVYSFGVLLLELLTGKSPVLATGTNEVVHLVRWVQSVVREEWTAEVFDLELMRYPGIEEEMVEMLQIAMACIARMPEQRPKMQDVLKMLEDVRRLDTDNKNSSGTRS